MFDLQFFFTRTPYICRQRENLIQGTTKKMESTKEIIYQIKRRLARRFEK